MFVVILPSGETAQVLPGGPYQVMTNDEILNDRIKSQ